MSAQSLDAALQKLAKWRKFFTSWQLGTHPDDGTAKAITNDAEHRIIMRAEVSALTILLVKKGVFTQAEFEKVLEQEAKALDALFEETFPGFSTSATGLHMKLPEARETMQRLAFPP